MYRVSNTCIREIDTPEPILAVLFTQIDNMSGIKESMGGHYAPADRVIRCHCCGIFIF